MGIDKDAELIASAIMTCGGTAATIENISQVTGLPESAVKGIVEELRRHNKAEKSGDLITMEFYIRNNEHRLKPLKKPIVKTGNGYAGTDADARKELLRIKARREKNRKAYRNRMKKAGHKQINVYLSPKALSIAEKVRSSKNEAMSDYINRIIIESESVSMDHPKKVSADLPRTGTRKRGTRSKMPEEHRTLLESTISELYESGMGWTQIEKELNRRGLPTMAGNRFHEKGGQARTIYEKAGI